MVRDGRIDTIVVAITDMQGRLMGKRVQGQAFLDGVISHGAHFCTYLLGTDMEMNTPEGYKLMNWETGYGDWIAEPVWDQLRVLPWLPGTAMVLADTIDEETGEEIPISPRTILKRQVARAAKAGYALKAGSEFEFYVLKDSWEDLAERGWPVPKTFGHYNEDYHLLQATKAEPLHRLLRNQMTAAERADRVQQGRGGQRPARGQHPLRPRPRVGRPERRLQARRQGDRLPQRLGHHVHGQAGPPLDRLVRAPAHEPVGPGQGRPADVRTGRRRRPVRMGCRVLGQHFVAGMMALSRELAVFIAPFINSYKRYASLSWAPVNVVWGRDNRTTGFRVVGRGPALHVEDRFPGGDMNAYLTYAAMMGAGLYGIEHELPLDPEFKGNGYLATGCPAHAARPVRGDLGAGALRGGGRDLRPGRRRPLPQRRAGRAGHVRLDGPPVGPRALPRARLTASAGDLAQPGGEIAVPGGLGRLGRRPAVVHAWRRDPRRLTGTARPARRRRRGRPGGGACSRRAASR